MDAEVVKKLQGKIATVRAEYGRTVSDGDYGSTRSSMALECNLSPDDSLKEVGSALQSLCEAFVNLQLKPAAKVVKEQAETPAPQHAPAKPEPTRTKVDDDGAEYEYVKVSSFVVQFTPNGKKVGKIKGGAYTKFGASVWPEVLATVGVDLDSLEAGEYQLPALTGKTAVCLMKVSDKSGKPYPEKVVEFVE